MLNEDKNIAKNVLINKMWMDPADRSYSIYSPKDYLPAVDKVWSKIELYPVST